MLQVNGCHEDGDFSGEPAKLRAGLAGFMRTVGKASTKVLRHLGAPLRNPTQKEPSVSILRYCSWRCAPRLSARKFL